MLAISWEADRIACILCRRPCLPTYILCIGNRSLPINIYMAEFPPPVREGLIKPRVIGADCQHFMLAIRPACQHSFYAGDAACRQKMLVGRRDCQHKILAW